MKKLIFIGLIIFIFLGIFANTVDAYVSVKGYYRSDGTYVRPHVRSNPNGLKYDNYGYKPSQGLYNKTYGTRDSYWDTPTYITDPYYYEGKSIYDSGNSVYFPQSFSNNYSSYYTPTPTCPSNSYYNGSSCTCNYGYINSGESCVDADSLCHAQLGYNSSYNSISDTCKCDFGYVIGTSGQCTDADNYCSDKIGIMSKYNSFSNKCECMYGYEFNGSSCVYKKAENTASAYSSYYTPKSSYTSTTVSCPANSYSSGGSCYCSSGYQISSNKSSCVAISTNTNDKLCTDNYGSGSHWLGTKTSSGSIICDCKSGYEWNTVRTRCVAKKYKPTPEDNKITGKNYYLKNKTCIGLSGIPYSECISYAYNH